MPGLTGRRCVDQRRLCYQQFKFVPLVRALLRHPLVGSIDQFSYSTDLVENPEWRATLKPLYD
jgi:hypothetical protein